MCVGTIDDTIGAISIYQHGISPKLARKIVMKTMVSSLSFTKKPDIEGIASEAIIPIQDEKIITFTYFFSQDCDRFRGGKQKYSLTIVFTEKRRLDIYEKANRLSIILRNLSNLFSIHLKGSTDLPAEFSEWIEDIYIDSIELLFKQDDPKELTLAVTCPVCTSSNHIKIQKFNDQASLIEHTIKKGDICSHQFQVYINDQLEILGYKEVKIDPEKLKKSIENLETPYDSILESIKTEQEI